MSVYKDYKRGVKKDFNDFLRQLQEKGSPIRYIIGYKTFQDKKQYLIVVNTEITRLCLGWF